VFLIAPPWASGLDIGYGGGWPPAWDTASATRHERHGGVEYRKIMFGRIPTVKIGQFSTQIMFFFRATFEKTGLASRNCLRDGRDGTSMTCALSTAVKNEPCRAFVERAGRAGVYQTPKIVRDSVHVFPWVCSSFP